MNGELLYPLPNGIYALLSEISRVYVRPPEKDAWNDQPARCVIKFTDEDEARLHL